MITLRKDKFIFDIPLKGIIDIDTKANILECFRLINMKVSSRYRKAELAEIYDMFLHKDAGCVLNRIPKAEWPILFALLLKKQDEYVEYPRDDRQFLFLQKCYLVMTYQTKDTWHLYMGDHIRTIIKDALNAPIDGLLSLQEMKETMDKIMNSIQQKPEIVESIPEQVYRKWKKTLHKPDDSIFYYHPSLDRIILGLAMYAMPHDPI